MGRLRLIGTTTGNVFRCKRRNTAGERTNHTICIRISAAPKAAVCILTTTS